MGRPRVVLGLLLLAASTDAFLPSALRPAVTRAASPRSKTCKLPCLALAKHCLWRLSCVVGSVRLALIWHQPQS